MPDALRPSEAPRWPDRARAPPASGRGLRLLWVCLGLGLLGMAMLIWVFGFTWWSVLIAALVVACPAIAAWMVLEGLGRWRWTRRTDR
jgi:hypothetical protein